MQNQACGVTAPILSSSRAGRRRGGMRAVNAGAGALLALGVVATLQAAMAPEPEAAVPHPVAFHGKPGGVVRLLADQPTMPLAAKPAAATVVEEPTAEQAAQAAEVLRGEAVRVAIEQWLAAWSQQDVAAYLAAYGKDFSPDKGMTRGDWEAMRRQRLSGRGTIAIAVHELEIELDGSTQAHARFLQDYRSGAYQERATPKQLALVLEDGAWRIVAEKSGQ